MARKGRKDRGLLQKTDSSGKVLWYVRLYHDGRERRFGSFPSKTAAREFYEKAKLEQKTGQFFPERYQQGGYAKLEEVMDSYLAAFTGRSKRDEERFKKKWAAIFPGARLNAITPTFLEGARAQLGEGRTPQTVNRYMGFLRRVLNKAVRDGKLSSNPVSRIRMVREPAGKTRFLSPEEEKALCDAIREGFAPMVRLAILTGMRQMEQFSLRWKHVDLERGLITLPATKAGGVQYVRLNQEARAILQTLDDQAALRLDGVSWHTLRHTFASRLAMSGATEGTIAALLRHSGTSLVRRYAHLSPSHLQQEIEKVAAFGKVITQEALVKKTMEPTSAEGETEDKEAAKAGPLPVFSVPTVTRTVTEVSARCAVE